MDETEKISRFLENRIPYAYVVETEFEDSLPPEMDEYSHPLRECLARSVVLSVDGRLCIAVIPATRQVDIDQMRRYLGAEKVRLAAEAEYRHLFSAGETGAIPVFGSLYGIPVLVAHELMDSEEIAFIVGTSQVIVRIRLLDFLVQEKPYVCARNAIVSRTPETASPSVMVYRLHEETMTKEPVGVLVERRKADRGNNALGMLRLARKEFGEAAEDPSQIVIDEGA